MGNRARALLVALTATLGLAAVAPASAEVQVVENRYVVVLRGNDEAAKGLVLANGGVIVEDLAKQIGVLIAESSNPAFGQALRASPLIDDAAHDFVVDAVPSSFAGAGRPENGVGGGPQPHADNLEPFQWSMRQIRAPQAHAIQAGSRAVEVAVIDTGIEGSHPDFVGADGSNVDCLRGRNFVTPPGIGDPDPCRDNNFHGTHVAGLIGARANGIGIVGVAPNVTLIPIKACDTLGRCFSSATVAAQTYAGDLRVEVMNMSYSVDIDQVPQETEYMCNNDPIERTFRKANERSIKYAIKQGVLPVAALLNDDHDLAHPPEPNENNCDVVPAETSGVVGTSATGPAQEKASYSNYGVGATDVAAPGGNIENPSGEFPGDCGRTVISTVPQTFGSWFCIQGTSMASPHAAGVAALIISQFGKLRDGDVQMPPGAVEASLQNTAVDIGREGYDACFGHGRVDALRAVTDDTSRAFVVTPPCADDTSGTTRSKNGK